MVYYLIFFLLASTISYGAQVCDWWKAYDLKKLAIVTIPVADMLINSAKDYAKAYPVNADSVYDNMPISCEPSGFPCVRVHQCLFNEIFFDATLSDNEWQTTLPDAYYAYNEKGQPQNSYYAHQKSAMTLEELANRGIDLAIIPIPTTLGLSQSAKTLTLTVPWHDVMTNKTYSAGTRFVRYPLYDTRRDYGIKIIDYKVMKVVSSSVSKNRCLLDKKRSLDHSRGLLLKILHAWVSLRNELPYVLGGSSFIATQRPGFFVVDTKSECQVYARPHEGRIKYGFDCSELIWRLCHIVGIPFSYKNSATLVSAVAPLAKDESIQEGDIIWMSGHVALISNIKKNELIESTGYSSGYGKLLKIKLSKRFEGISSYKDLISAYHEQRALVRIEKTGERKRYSEFKIFKLYRPAKKGVI